MWFLHVAAAQFVFQSATEREVVRSLVRLNQIVYPQRDFNYTVLAPIYDTRANLYKEFFSNPDELFSEGQALASLESDAFTTNLASATVGIEDKFDVKFHPPSGETLGFGVKAMKYTDADRQVIVFRGGTNRAEYHDMMLSMEGWFLDKMKSKIKDTWLNYTDALPADAAQREAAEDLPDRVSILAGSWSLLARDTPDWTKLDWKVQWESLLRDGYWSLVKELVREWLPKGRDTSTEIKTYITGHGQGGFYAQLVSMWLEKEDGIRYDAYSFNAPGVQCAIRYALNADFSGDMDIMALHPQITQYVHALDPYGNMDFTAGKVCKFGTTDLQLPAHLATATKSFCGKIVGYSGAKFVSRSEEWKAFMRCLYFTHSVDAVWHWLGQDSVLNNDGTTDGSCQNEALVPANPTTMCPACASDRCVDKIPKPGFNWKLPANNPCTSGTTEARLEMREFSNTDFDLFNQCLVLGRNAYALLGSSADPAHNMTFVSLALQYSLSARLPSISPQVAVGLQSVSGGTRVIMHGPPKDEENVPLVDAVINLTEKTCSPSLFGVEICVASQSARRLAGRRLLAGSELFLTLGFAQTSDAIATKIGILTEGTLDVSSRMLPSRSIQQEVVALKNQAAAFTDAVPSYSPHPCRPGSDQAVGLFEQVTSADSTCIALGKDSSISVTHMKTEVPAQPPVDATNCYARVRELVMESFVEGEALDREILDGMITVLFQGCTKQKTADDCNAQMNEKQPVAEQLCTWQSEVCESVIKQDLENAGLYDASFQDYFDDVTECALRNAPMTEFVCDVIDKASLWPNVATSEERIAEIKRSVHYAILLEYIIRITEDHDSSDFLLNKLFASLNPLIPTIQDAQVANTFELAKLHTISYNVKTWNPPNTCCETNMPALGFKVNVMEAVMEDLRLGYPENANTGLAMSIAPTKRVSTTQEHVDLYTTWNMAFVSHYGASPYFYAKLLTPSVLCAEPKYYVYNRVIALYIHLFSVLLSRVEQKANPGAAVIVPDMDWVNKEMTRQWGVINQAHSDYWLQREVLPSLLGAGQAVRLDLVYSAFDRTVNSVVVAGIKNDFNQLHLDTSQDGAAEFSLPLNEGSPSCLQLLGGFDLCFELSTTTRRLSSSDAFDSPISIVNAYILGMKFQSKNVKVFDVPTPHPCLQHAFGLEPTDEVFMQEAGCTVLGPSSYLHALKECEQEDCTWNLNLFADLLGTRRLETSFASVEQKITMTIKIQGENVRAIIRSNAVQLYDVVLPSGSKQCLKSQSLSICVERADTLIISMDVLGVRREMSLSSIAGGKFVFNQPMTWGLTALRKLDGDPVDYDPCNDVVCGEDEQCAMGTEGQNPCFPSLFKAFDGPILLDQLLSIARSPYAEFAIDVYEDDGWTLSHRECLAEEVGKERWVLGRDSREDCLLVYSKITNNGPTCTVAFEGSDDPSEAIESAITLGRVLHHGYWVWRGMKQEYEGYKRMQLWPIMLNMVRDPVQCKQVFITGHSFGASLSVMFRLEYGFGRVVGFATNNMFPPGFAPKTAMGESFRKQLDAVQALPPGWVSGGLREHVLCDNGNIWNRGVNPTRRFGGKDFCSPAEHAVLSYQAWTSEYLQTAQFGTCADVDWVGRCIDKVCSTGGGLCALGEQVMRAQLLYKAKSAETMEQLAQLPSAWDTASRGLCPESVEEGEGCLNLGNNGFMKVLSRMQADSDSLRTMITLSPYLDETLELQIVVREDNVVEIRMSIAGQTIPLAYELSPSSHICPDVADVPPVRGCLQYQDQVISVVAFLHDEISYSMEIARVTLSPLSVSMIPDLPRASAFSSPEVMFRDLENIGRVVYPQQGYCNKITSRCLADNSCEPWRKSQCVVSIGVCACDPGFCSDSQGMCVPKEDVSALIVSQNPCVEPDAPFIPLVFLADPSGGLPYERCVILSEASFIRLDFPTPDESMAVIQGEPLVFRALLKLGLPVLPISFERIFRVEVRFVLVPVFTATITLIDETANRVMEEATFVIMQTSTAQSLCTSFVSAALSTISLADVCLLLSPPTTVPRRLSARHLEAEKLCSLDDTSDCDVDDHCRTSLDEGSANCTDIYKNCVCVDARFDEPLIETRIDASVVLPSVDSTSDHKIQIASARSDGDVIVHTPSKGDEMQVEPTTPEPADWLTPSILIFLGCFAFCFVSLLAGFVFGQDADGEGDRIFESDRSSKGKFSAVQFARDFHDESLSMSVATSNPNSLPERVRTTAQRLYISRPRLRYLFCNALPTHFMRLQYMHHKVNNIKFFADEEGCVGSKYTVPIRRFLCWRRSVMVIFVCLSTLMIAMGAGEELPRIVRAHFGSGGSQMSNAELQRTVKLMAAFGDTGIRRLDQEAEGGLSQSARALEEQQPQATDLERARMLLDRLQLYCTLLYMVKLVVSLVCLFSVVCALRKWPNYRISAGWTLCCLVVRVVVAVCMTFIPWYVVIFDDQDFPAYMTHSAKVYMAFLINAPLFSLSFMVTPALVSGSMIVIHLMPYSILPYMVIFIGPMLSMVALWPMLSAVGHGSANWLVLYGAWIYVAYACVTATVAFRSLQSLEAVRTLGKRTFHNSRKDTLEDQIGSQGCPTPANSVAVSRMEIPVDDAHRSYSPFECNMESERKDKPEGITTFFGEEGAKSQGASSPNRIFATENTTDEATQGNCKHIQAYSDGVDESRRSSTMVEFERFASEKILNRGSELKVFRTRTSIKEAEEAKIARGKGISTRSQTRGSMEIAELLVQGSLIADLEHKMQPRMRLGFVVAGWLYYAGAALLVFAIIQESKQVLEVMINGGSLWGCVIASLVDCFINKLLMQMIFVDFLINGMIKLRLFNGYMSDDTVLSEFVGLKGFAMLLTEEFRKGVKEEEKIEERRRVEMDKAKEALIKKQLLQELKGDVVGSSPLSPRFSRKARRSSSLPSRRKDINSAACITDSPDEGQPRSRRSIHGSQRSILGSQRSISTRVSQQSPSHRASSQRNITTSQRSLPASSSHRTVPGDN